jgi:hypothetical protein
VSPAGSARAIRTDAGKKPAAAAVVSDKAFKEFLMKTNHTRTVSARIALIIGALAVLATGLDHLEEYTANQFYSVPTIGTLFLLNFVAATLVAIGLLLPLRRIFRRAADPLRALLALSGIGIALSSLIGLWISETSSLFGFTDHGYRPAIIEAIVAEAVAIAALSAYLALAELCLPRLHTRLSHR